MKIDINGVSITLTTDQLAEIAKQTQSKLTLDNLYSIQDAEKILSDCKSHIKFDSSQFCRVKDWTTYQLETIIKAANYIDNNHSEWIPDFTNSNITKYLPYWEKKASGWSLVCVVSFSVGSGCSVGLFYMKKSTAELLAKRFDSLYQNYLG